MAGTRRKRDWHNLVERASILDDTPQAPSFLYKIHANWDSPYPSPRTSLRFSGISSEYSLPADPHQWGFDLSPRLIEPDDELHKSSTRANQVERGGHFFSTRGLENFGCLLLLCVGLLALFLGYPVATYFARSFSTQGGFNLGGVNATGQIPQMGNWRLIDLDTPQDAYRKPSWADSSKTLQLVFSDEFNTDGRTFYPGDDPYWEAVDLHYWATNNLEWYDPEAATTQGGSLVITLSQKNNHDLQYQSAMISTWNKFCFTGGYIETSVQLPGANNVLGFWPSVWTMGNLGRAGYGASLEGLWPYSYDTCDVGTTPNQTINGQPVAATVNGDQGHGGILSFLPGQRLSRCTCRGESHPGPFHKDGTYVGRSAPEIDALEAQISQDTLVAQVSQSAQWAPFNEGYIWPNASNMIITDPSKSGLNSYSGGVSQQATSVVTATNPLCYELDGGCYSVYGFEYKPGFDNAYITWISDNQISWSLKAAGVGPDPNVNISARPVSQEPMYLIVNLGMSTNFGPVDTSHLTFPAHMRVDYIRVYQPEGAVNIGCNPKDFPTENYINTYIEAYTNPNLTTWVNDFKQPWTKSSLLGGC